MKRILPWLMPLAVAGCMLRVIGGTDRFPAADGPHMLAQAERLGQWVRQGHLLAVARELSTLTAPHPPVGYLPSVLAAVFTSSTRAVVALSSTAAVLLVLDALQRLCRPSPWWQAQLVWLLGLSGGLTWWSADHYGYDLAAAATILQALSWLQASEHLSRRRESLLFGAWLAVAFLTKYSAPLVLAVPVVAWCAPALRDRRRNLAWAMAAWALLAVPYYALNWGPVTDYVDSALNPRAMPGNFPEERTFLQRFGGEGQLMFLVALKDALGWPGLAVLAVGAVRARRWLPLLALASGVVLLGSMNSREGRYALPLVFLLCAAGAPALRASWHHAAVLLAVTLPGLRGSVASYAGTPRTEAPSRRVLEHPTSSLATLAPWPRPAMPFEPISEHPERWQVESVVEAMAEQAQPGERVLIVLDQSMLAPFSAVYQLIAEEHRTGLHLETLHLQLQGEQLLETSYLAPFQPLVSGTEARLAYVVTRTDGAVGQEWLERYGGEELRRWSLPTGHTGRLVRVRNRPVAVGGPGGPPGPPPGGGS